VTAAHLGKYDTYAFERVIEKINLLIRAHPNLSLSAMASAISDWRNTTFHREYFTRLRKFTLTDPHVDTIIEWIVAHHDEKFRETLTPESIFAHVGESSYNFYYHLSQIEDYDTWEEDVLQAFAGVYLCAPAHDRNSYLPMPMVRDYFENKDQLDPAEKLKRSSDIKQYIAERSILILRATPMGYYHAAEFPLSLLFPPDFVTLDLKMVHEGVGIASGNSIRVFFRECLSRVGKSHSIVITENGKNEAENPHELALFTSGPVRQYVRDAWAAMDARNLRHMREEFADALDLGYLLEGNAQIELSPIPDVKNRVVMSFTRDYVYHRKPADFLRNPDTHFIRPDIEDAAQVERIITNPLVVGALT
jgi:hypothetical protein